MDSRFLLSLAVFALALGCSNSAHSTLSRRDSYAQATCMDSVTCCVQRNPGNSEACGLTASEAAAILAAGAAVTAATLSTTDEEDDPDEGWRQHCIDTYVLCKSQSKPRWVGDCYACLRNCEGQRQWPFSLCYRGR